MKKLILLLAMAWTAAAHAEQGEIPINPALRDRFYFALGGYFPTTTTEAQLNSTRLGVGTNITLEDTLGMDGKRAVPTAIARWRFAERFRLEAEFFQLNRSGQRVVDRDIRWGDQVFPVNSNVRSEFDFFDLRVSAGYAFFKRPDKELGIALGFHIAAYDVSLTANTIPTEQQDVLAPLPVLSFYGQFALTEQWAVGARLDRFSLSYDKYEGSLSAMGLDLTYQPFRHVGFGVAYRALFIRMEATDDVKTLRFKQTFEGPLLYMNVSF